MRPSILSRALLAVWGLWFTAALSEVPGLHACAVHDGPAPAAIASGHAGHASHAAKTAPAHDESHHSARCTCLGMCCCAAPAVVPASPVVLPETMVVAMSATVDRAVERPASRRAYSLPFGNGPPTL